MAAFCATLEKMVSYDKRPVQCLENCAGTELVARRILIIERSARPSPAVQTSGVVGIGHRPGGMDRMISRGVCDWHPKKVAAIERLGRFGQEELESYKETTSQDPRRRWPEVPVAARGDVRPLPFRRAWRWRHRSETLLSWCTRRRVVMDRRIEETCEAITALWTRARGMSARRSCWVVMFVR